MKFLGICIVNPVLQKNIFKKWLKMFLTCLTAGFVKSNINLWKPIDSHLFKNVLLKLFSFQFCLFYFHNMAKFYKNLCSPWRNHTYAELFSPRLTSCASYKYNRNLFDLFKCNSMDFIKLMSQETINLWHFFCACD